tara:strand:+ start:516 stop:944 length:429 start_codon:yes stop_codon:yes gene_type:complete
MTELSKAERKKLKRQLLKDERSKQRSDQQRSSKNKKLIWSGAIIVLVLIVGVYAYTQAKAPGQYDNLAKCLTEREVVMYGAEWCKYTAEQKTVFGKSFDLLDYKDYTENPAVKITPTWVIGGQSYERVQSAERLASLSGCKI